MCDQCGCNSEPAHSHNHGHDHSHNHGHDHSHDHSHPHSHDHKHSSGGENSHNPGPIQAGPATSSVSVNLEEKVLSKNEEAAARNRKWLTERNIVTVNLISSPGTGKTLLLEKTLAVLRDRVECAVIAGDQRTDRDSARIRATGAKVIQIETGDACHLNAEQVGSAMQDVADDSTGILFIENVGNLVCPSAFDLGEDFKVGMVSVTEGEDKPVKYPSLFSRAPVSVVTKIDLLPHLDFDIGRCRSFLRQVHPGMFVFELSAKTGEGMESWIDYLLNLAQP